VIQITLPDPFRSNLKLPDRLEDPPIEDTNSGDHQQGRKEQQPATQQG